MTPVAVADGDAALAELQSAAESGRFFQLVIVDAAMPETDGFALAQQIKRRPDLGGAAVLMLRLASRPGDTVRTEAAGVAAWDLLSLADGRLFRGAGLGARHREH